MHALAAVNMTVFVVSFAIYTALIILVGVYSSRFAKQSNEDFFLAGRSLGRWVAGLSASASSESGWVTLGLVGWAFTEGVQAYWILPGCLLGYAFNWFVIAGRMSAAGRRSGALTLPDLFAFHFRERVPLLRSLCVLVTLVAMFLYVSAQFAAAGKAFGVILDETELIALDTSDTSSAADVTSDAGGEEPTESEPATDDNAEAASAAAAQDTATQETAAQATSPSDATFFGLIPLKWGAYQFGVLIGAAIVLLYTIGGGFRAVCWTDFAQALLMLGTLVVFPIYLLFDTGGWSFIHDQLSQAAPQLLQFTPKTGMFAFVGFLFGHGALGINFGYPGQPHVLVRFLALRDRREARMAGVIAILWGAFVYWGAVTVGLCARAMAESGATWTRPMMDNPDIYGELGLVLSSLNMLPSIMAGLVLAAVLAAICSTADSQIVVAASSVASDLYARVIRGSSAAAHMVANRLTVACLGFLAVLSVLNSEVRVYKYVLTYGWAVLGAAFGPQVILLLLWRRASYVGCLAGMLTGFVVALVWPSVYNEAETGVHIYNLPLAFLAALVVNVVLSLLLPPTQDVGATAELEDAPSPQTAGASASTGDNEQA
jgi:Na+/proline symporter